ncbi:MAG: hypothetical protein M3N49_04420 [Candidatus Eremiobacteraeota bacterium]|nr:hypothetical protein [Candidatus Eremiobacteraeota bacterium]
MGPRSDLPLSWRHWSRLVYDRWAAHVRNPAVSALLLVATAAVAVGTYFAHWPWGTGATAGIGAVALIWAAYSVPVAAHAVWRDERVARIAALESAAPGTLRLAVYDLARKIYEWLKTIPAGIGDNEESAAVIDGYNERFAHRVAEIAARLNVAAFPEKPSWLFNEAPKNKKDALFIAGDLEIWGKRIPADFPA